MYLLSLTSELEHQNSKTQVQEQEKEVLKTKKVTPARRRGDGNNSLGRKQFALQNLISSKGRQEIFKSAVFYPLRSFRIGGKKDDVEIPFPFELLISENHSEMMRATNEPRRMKNTYVVLRWVRGVRSFSLLHVSMTSLKSQEYNSTQVPIEVSQKIQDEQKVKHEKKIVANLDEKVSQLQVMMTEFEADELRLLLHHFKGDLEEILQKYMIEGEDAIRELLQSSSDMIEMEETKTSTQSGEKTSTLRQSLDSRKEFCVILSLLEAEAVRKRHQNSSSSSDFRKRVELYTLSGKRLTSSLDKPSALQPPSLVRATTEQIIRIDPNVFRNAVACAKFFDSMLWYVVVSLD